jgi:hypothetical protein
VDAACGEGVDAARAQDVGAACAEGAEGAGAARTLNPAV